MSMLFEERNQTLKPFLSKDKAIVEEPIDYIDMSKFDPDLIADQWINLIEEAK